MSRFWSTSIPPVGTQFCRGVVSQEIRYMTFRFLCTLFHRNGHQWFLRWDAKNLVFKNGSMRGHFARPPRPSFVYVCPLGPREWPFPFGLRGQNYSGLVFARPSLPSKDLTRPRKCRYDLIHGRRPENHLGIFGLDHQSLELGFWPLFVNFGLDEFGGTYRCHTLLTSGYVANCIVLRW